MPYGRIVGERSGRFVEDAVVPEPLRERADAFAALAERAGPDADVVSP